MDNRPKPWRMEDVIIFEKPQFISLGVTNATESATHNLSEIEIESNVSEHQIGTVNDPLHTPVINDPLHTPVINDPLHTPVINDPLHTPEHSFNGTNNLSKTKENISTHNNVKIKIEHENYNDTDDPLAIKENPGNLCIKTEPEDHIVINNISSTTNDISVKLESCDVKDEFQIYMENLNSDIQCSNMIETYNGSNVTSLGCIRKKRSYCHKSDSAVHSVKKRRTFCKCKNQVVTPNSLPSDWSTQNNKVLEETNIFISPNLDTSELSNYSVQNEQSVVSMQNEQTVVQNEECVMQNKKSVTKNESDICSSCGNFKRKRKLGKMIPDLNEGNNSSLSNQKIKKGKKPRKKFQSCNSDTVKFSDNLEKKNEGNIDQVEKLKRARKSSTTCKNQSRSLTNKVDLTNLFSEDDLKNFEIGNEKLGQCATVEDIMCIPRTPSDHEGSTNVDLCTVLKWYRIPSDKLAFHQDQNPHVCVDICKAKRRTVRNCPLCPEQFYMMCNVPYDTHVLIHTNYKMYQCPKCPKTFPLMLNLHSHLDSHFKLTYKCGRCNETFAHKCKLLYHHTSHSDVYPFRCKGCGDLFSTNLELTYHRVNSCEEPFKCVICNSTFKWYSQLRLHRRKHETKRPYRCLYCANTFIWSAHFYYHLEETHNIDMTYLWNWREYEYYRRPGKYTFL